MLTNLTKKDMGITKWDPHCDMEFDKLRKALVTASILIAPDWDRELQVIVDASSFALGAILTQKDEEDNTRVIAYASKKLSNPERNYTENDRKMTHTCFTAFSMLS